ncbi:MAG: hypothetical protein AAFW46_11040 [Pseudomonadota bacterium]
MSDRNPGRRRTNGFSTPSSPGRTNSSAASAATFSAVKPAAQPVSLYFTVYDGADKDQIKGFETGSEIIAFTDDGPIDFDAREGDRFFRGMGAARLKPWKGPPRLGIAPATPQATIRVCAPFALLVRNSLR